MGLIPIFVEGENLRGTEDDVFAAMDAAYEAQYSPGTLEIYRQKPKSEKLLMIDNFDESRLSIDQQYALLPLLHRVADRVIVFVDGNVFQINEITAKGPKRPFADYEHCELYPFPPSLRRALIKKWVSVGIATSEMTAEQVDREVRTRDNILAALLPRQSLPPFPMNILGLLQGYEAQANLNTADGSYGELCEWMITERLRLVGKRNPAEVKTRYHFLSRLAYFLFSRGQRWISQEDLLTIRAEYFRAFDIDLDVNTLTNDAIQAELIALEDGNYRFRYNSYYYFFAGRYFKDALADPSESASTRATAADLADHLYYEPYVNILIFYLYFTHDIPTIEYILGNAKRIYGSQPVCSLEEEVDYLNRLYVEPAKPILIGEADLHDHRQRQQDDLDVEFNAPLTPLDEADRAVTYADDLDEIKKLNIAFKTLQVLGQVLRNFPNVLKGELKTRVAQQCYSLGLRVLSAILALGRENMEDLRGYFAAIIREQRKIASQADLAVETDTFMIRILAGCTYSVIKRVSMAVGSDQLAETYRNVFRVDGEKPSVAMIDLSIKLDHFPGYPMVELERLFNRVEHNRFAYSILRDLVVNDAIMRDIGLQIRQQLARLLQIDLGEVTEGVKLLG